MINLLENEKRIAGIKAVNFVKSGMVLGLGTGSTVRYFLEALAEKVNGGMDIIGVPTSKKTEQLAISLGIKTSNSTDHVDLTIDGADEIDHSGRMIKGGGGALFKERIVASHSNEIVIVCDHSKYVETLGKFPVPVEISPFMELLTIKMIGKLCPNVTLRNNGEFLTDQGNHIVDCNFDNIENPEETYQILRSVPGVVDVGIFLHMKPTLILGEKGYAREIKLGENVTSERT